MSGGGMNLGEKIREARKRRRLTLERVAAVTGLSIGFLSQVERDITRPSLTSLVTIARALEVPVGTLLYQRDIPNVLSRGENRVAYAMDQDRASYEPLSLCLPGQMLSPVKVNVPPRYSVDAPAHEGEAIVYVLDGTVRFTIDETIYELQASDSLHYSTGRPHRLSNPTDRAAALLFVGTPPKPHDPERLRESVRLDGANPVPPQAHDGTGSFG